MNMVKLAVAQSHTVLGDPARNVDEALRYIREAAAEGVRLVVFPECSLTGYVCESAEECADFAIEATSAHIDTIAEAARDLSISVVVGYLEVTTAGEEVFNTATLLNPDGSRTSYRKAHLPAVFADRFVSPGDQDPVVADSPIGKIGLSICYDIRFPEWARSLALQGARIIASPVNFLRSANRVYDAFPRARAHENAVYFLLANRGDEERGTEFLGKSSIFAPSGDLLATCDRSPGLVVAEVDLDVAGKGVVVYEPGVSEAHFLRDRRPELYGALTNRSD